MTETPMERMKRWIQASLLGLAVGCSADPSAEMARRLESKDVEIRRAALRELGQQAGEAKQFREALANLLRDKDLEVRRLACLAFGTIGSAAKPDLPALSLCFQDRELSVRLAAAFAVRKIDLESRAYVPVFVRAMETGEGGTIDAVGKMGESADWAVPTLIKLLQDKRPGIRRLAAEALGRIGAKAKPAASALRSALRDSDDRVRETAQEALPKIEQPVP